PARAGQNEKGTQHATGSCHQTSGRGSRQQLSAAREYYVNLIVQHDQMIREGKLEASTLDITIQKERRRRNIAGRPLPYHPISHPTARTASMRVISITAAAATTSTRTNTTRRAATDGHGKDCHVQRWEVHTSRPE